MTQDFIGVRKNGERWKALLPGHEYEIGSFTTAIEAAKAVDAEILNRFSKDAITNAKLGLLGDK